MTDEFIEVVHCLGIPGLLSTAVQKNSDLDARC